MTENKTKILVTGAAGFIGFHVAKRLLEDGFDVTGIDNLNDYYDVNLKEARLGLLRPFENFRFQKLDIADRETMEKLFAESEFNRVIHLAAQAGVRYSIQNPHVYIQSNIVGFTNVLEGCRHQWGEFPLLCKEGEGEVGLGSTPPQPSPYKGEGADVHLVYASSSSVYGSNTKLPFSVKDNVDHPISLYAATKKANELMAHTYSHLYGIPATGLRFFTVYGPWGRPDMALFKFTKAILEGKPIDVYNNGKMRRDFTYIDDIVEGVIRVNEHIPGQITADHAPCLAKNGSGPTAHGAWKEGLNVLPCALRPVPYALYNIGNHSPVELMDFIRAIEEGTGKKAKMNFLPMQAGDVPATFADVDDLMRDVDFAPKTPIREGIRKFVDWYHLYYKG